MTLNDLINRLESISLAHKDVRRFDIGSSYNRAEDNGGEYPLVYLELPYQYNYNANLDRLDDSLNIQLDILLESNLDNVKDDHKAIAIAKEIADAILMYITVRETNKFTIQTASGMSLREFSDDNVSGWRLDLDLVFVRDLCTYTNLDELFDEEL